jgi:hypothetical protein
MNNLHPSQIQTPVSQNDNIQYVSQQPNNTNNMYVNERATGRIINKAFYLTLLFLALSNGYGFLNNVYHLWSNQYVVLDDNGLPTPKGYVFMSILFFVATFIVLRKK